MSPQALNDLAAGSVAVAAFIGFFFVHLLVWQVLPARRKGVLFLVGIASIAYATTVWFHPVPLLDHVWVSAPFMAFLVVFYMHLYFGIDRSLSVRILGELVQSPNGELSLAELDAVYPVQDMVARRLAVMLEKNQVALRDGKYHCTPRGRFMVSLALLGKRLYALKMTG